MPKYHSPDTTLEVARCDCGLYIPGHEARALLERRGRRSAQDKHLPSVPPLLFLFLPDIVQLQEALPVSPTVLLIALALVIIAVVLALAAPVLRGLAVAVFVLVIIFLIFETTDGGWGLG